MIFLATMTHGKRTAGHLTRWKLFLNMTTIQFWQGLMLGACLQALLTIAFTVWQEKRDDKNATNKQP